MATVKQYANQLTQRAVVIAKAFGANVEGADKETRVLLRTVQVELAIIVKLLVDKGLVTDAELIAAFDAAAADTYPDEPTQPQT